MCASSWYNAINRDASLGSLSYVARLPLNHKIQSWIRNFHRLPFPKLISGRIPLKLFVQIASKQWDDSNNNKSIIHRESKARVRYVVSTKYRVEEGTLTLFYFQWHTFDLWWCVQVCKYNCTIIIFEPCDMNNVEWWLYYKIRTLIHSNERWLLIQK